MVSPIQSFVSPSTALVSKSSSSFDTAMSDATPADDSNKRSPGSLNDDGSPKRLKYGAEVEGEALEDEDAIQSFLKKNAIEVREEGITPSNNRKIRRARTKIKNKNGEIEDSESFYVTDGNIKFRHRGSDKRIPGTFFLRSLQAKKYRGKVLVHYSCSGSGKTVDLAGSGCTRGSDLAIVVAMQDSKEIKEASDERKRNKIGRKLLKEKIESVVKKCKDVLTLAKHATAERPLEINIGIDEASSCPKVVRSIVARQFPFSEAVAEVLAGDQDKDASKKIKVAFSVAGTGVRVHAAAVGSNTQNFEVVDPAGRGFGEEMFESFIGDGIHLNFPGVGIILVTYDAIKEHLPIVETLIRNGRMSSIAAAILSKRTRTEKEKHEVLVEAKLVQDIVEAYMESNGMKPLVKDASRRHQVAACALAVHLFQWNSENRGTAPKNDDEFQEYMSKMPCGVEFMKTVERNVSEEKNGSAMRSIVSKFGLLEPSEKAAHVTSGGLLYDLYVMQPSQQMVALVMLGADLGSAMELSPTGFEFLSTHILKCAIASTCMIDENAPRPSLFCVLTKIGFRVDPNATSDDANKEKFEALKNCKVKYYALEKEDGEANAVDDDYPYNSFYQTKLMDVELDTTELVTDGNEKGKGYLQIDQNAFSELKMMKPCACGMILNDLLNVLEKKRNVRTRISLNTVLCDSEGKKNDDIERVYNV